MTRQTWIDRLDRGVTVGLVAVVIATAALWFWRSQASVPDEATDTSRAVPRIATTMAGGTELVIIVIGTSDCPGCVWEPFQESIKTLRDSVRHRATARGWSVTTIGVAMDYNVMNGLRFIDGLGEVDEISVGNNWINSLLLRYLWIDNPGPPIIPQVIILKRTIEMSNESGPSSLTETVLHRQIRGQGIADWVTAGAPFSMEN